MKSQHHLLKSWSRCLLVAAMLGCSAVALAAPSVASRLEPGEMMVAKAGAARAATINTILDRWLAVAAAQGENIAVWRDVMSIQLSQMTEEGLAKLAALNPGTDLRQQATAYASFLSVLGADIGARYLEQHKGTSEQKLLGDTTVDLTFQPVPPCRLVDTRNVGGPIAGFGTRNFYGWSDTSGLNLGTAQGGISGAIGTVCPNVYFATGFPTAAALTVTVVNQGGAGNLIAWSGVGTQPTASALNYGAFGTVGAVANTTVVPMNVGRGTTSRDFAITVNAGTATDVVVDVVGYFRQSHATALECVDTGVTTVAIAAGTGGSATPPACPAGYNQVAPVCNTNTSQPLVSLGWTAGNVCYYWNFDSVSHSATVQQRCCRVPGL